MRAVAGTRAEQDARAPLRSGRLHRSGAHVCSGRLAGDWRDATFASSTRAKGGSVGAGRRRRRTRSSAWKPAPRGRAGANSIARGAASAGQGVTARVDDPRPTRGCTRPWLSTHHLRSATRVRPGESLASPGCRRCGAMRTRRRREQAGNKQLWNTTARNEHQHPVYPCYERSTARNDAEWNRARPDLQAGGRGFEPLTAHRNIPANSTVRRLVRRMLRAGNKQLFTQPSIHVRTQLGEPSAASEWKVIRTTSAVRPERAPSLCRARVCREPSPSR